MRKRSALVGMAVLVAFVGCAGDGTGPGAGRLPYRTKVTESQQDPQQTPSAASIIYVSDFELEIAEQPAEQQPILNGPVRGVLGALRGESQDPAAKARELVDLMSMSIVKDLTEKQLSAQRLLPGELLPKTGWLVRGVVTELDEGNRLRKAVIGFGAGKSQLELYVNVVDLAKAPTTPFYTFEASNNSGDMPGAAVMKMNPYAAAAKFVMSRHADEKEVSHTAETIAEQISERMQATAGVGATGG